VIGIIKQLFSLAAFSGKSLLWVLTGDGWCSTPVSDTFFIVCQPVTVSVAKSCSNVLEHGRCLIPVILRFFGGLRSNSLCLQVCCGPWRLAWSSTYLRMLALALSSPQGFLGKG
jgi:hypothetical protein